MDSNRFPIGMNAPARLLQANFRNGKLPAALQAVSKPSLATANLHPPPFRNPNTAQRASIVHAFRPAPGILDGTRSSLGTPLPDPVRHKMESFFRSDFSQVRIYQGPQASALGALAFTVGTEIYFAPGQYQPYTQRGQELLGHELMHVLQQKQGRVSNPYGSGLAVVHDIALEQEAERQGQLAAKHQGWHRPSSNPVQKPPAVVTSEELPRAPVSRPKDLHVQLANSKSLRNEEFSTPKFSSFERLPLAKLPEVVQLAGVDDEPGQLLAFVFAPGRALMVVHETNNSAFRKGAAQGKIAYGPGPSAPTPRSSTNALALQRSQKSDDEEESKKNRRQGRVTRVLRVDQHKRPRIGVNTTRRSEESLRRNLPDNLITKGRGKTKMTRLYSYMRKFGGAGMQGYHRGIGKRPHIVREILNKMLNDPTRTTRSSRGPKFLIVSVDLDRLQPEQVLDLSKSTVKSSFSKVYGGKQSTTGKDYMKMYQTHEKEGVVVIDGSIPRSAVVGLRAFRGVPSEQELGDILDDIVQSDSEDQEEEVSPLDEETGSSIFSRQDDDDDDPSSTGGVEVF